MRIILTILTVAVVMSSPALAVDDGSTPPPSTETTEKCSGQKIFDKETQKCVDADHQSFNDDTRYKAVRELAYAGAYDRALGVIAKADDTSDPRFLNYRGFIARKTGNMDDAMAFYTAALKQNPDYLLARSYMGQGLIAMGDIDGAKAQLREISLRGGRNTWPYFALKQSIRSGPSSGY